MVGIGKRISGPGKKLAGVSLPKRGSGERRRREEIQESTLPLGEEDHKGPTVTKMVGGGTKISFSQLTVNF